MLTEKKKNQKPDSRAPLPKTTSTHLIECTEVKLVLAWSLHLYLLISLTLAGMLQAMEREAWTLIPPQNATDL